MNHTTNGLRGAIALFMAAFIWGIAFVAQSKGGEAMGAFTFNATRFVMGGFVLIPLILFFRSREAGAQGAPLPLRSGIVIGCALAIASNLQQVGITMGAAAGKAGFLTACYIVLVPILGILLGKKCPAKVWLAVLITLVGLYLLCIKDSFSLSRPDILLLLCALCFSIQILCIDAFAPGANAVELSCIEFFTCGILSAVPALICEVIPHPEQTLASFATADAWIPLLYAGICSTGIAYTLQVVGQASVHPTIASLLMSLESVFSVLAGWVLLHEHLTLREGIGCALIFLAVVIAQIGENDF
ncbi:MAG: DMT family transporter [Lachnospiraceae bacterium]|nr:DMT family transporter [Lachnospiraceae bacterium]